MAITASDANLCLGDLDEFLTVPRESVDGKRLVQTSATIVRDAKYLIQLLQQSLSSLKDLGIKLESVLV